jgi:gamma-glutamylcyclotransferase (GGCT)/AIG2-like uncharacterized protein YtfP
MKDQNMSKIYTVFVYGTLKKGFHNQYILGDSLYLGKGTLLNYAIKFAHGSTGFPVMFKRKNNTVHGEVYAVNEKVLSMLDQLEAEGNMYHRKKIKVNMGVETIPAYSYMGDKDFWDFKNMNDVGKKEHNWNV